MKDERYKAVKSLIQSNTLEGLKSIFTYIPLTVVRLDMKVNYHTFRRHIENPELLTIREIYLMAELFEVAASDVFRLIAADMNKGKKRKKID